MNKAKIFSVVLFVVVTFAFTRCGSDNPSPKNFADVYVAGEYLKGAIKIPAYWKNGEVVELSQSAGAAEGIAVIGEDVYVVGYLSANTITTKKLWKNGVMTDFSDADASTKDYVNVVRVFGNDWYAAGAQADATGDHATYWKNGVMHRIVTQNESRAHDIAVEGNDVYVAGYHEKQNVSVATYWKNDNPTALTVSNTPSIASGIAVQDGDVYVSGEEGLVLRAWKNGTLLEMDDAADCYGVSGNLVMIKNDVYILGKKLSMLNFTPKYWKNGKIKPLQIPQNSIDVVVNGVATDGDDVYMMGNVIMNSEKRTLIWRNFKLMAPFNGNTKGFGLGLCVVSYNE